MYTSVIGPCNFFHSINVLSPLNLEQIHTMIVLKFICLVYLPFVTFGNTSVFTQSRK